MITSKQFLFFLLDTPTGRAYVETPTGMVLLAPVTAGTTDFTLRYAPGNWIDTTLSFIRNDVYHGINRSFSTPQQFVKSVGNMVNKLVLLGVGTEVPLTLACFNYNSQPQTGEPMYELLYKGNLDLINTEAQLLSFYQTNLMDGGVAQLLKNYEDTEVQIPCDGSVLENIKINLDGHLVEDTFFYQINNVKSGDQTANWVPLTYTGNEGDNYGIVQGNSTYTEVGDDASNLTTANFILYSTSPIKIKVKGNIIVTNNNHGINVKFRMHYRNQFPSSQVEFIPFTSISQTQNFPFAFEVTLQANEKFFIVTQYTSVDAITDFEIVGGNISIEFNSKAKDTRPWAIMGADLAKLTWADVNTRASKGGQLFNYPFTTSVPELINEYAFTSGDALRASGDPSYQRYYAVNEIGQTSFGPVIKPTLKGLFNDFDVLLNLAMGSGHTGVMESLFIEYYRYVYNPDVITMDIGEVAQVNWKFAKDRMWSDVSIGYQPQEYDQRAGKYETNTTLKMKLPVNSFKNELVKVSKTRWDSYGIERIRSNVGGTSTTRNTGDSQIFGMHIDRSKFFYDFFVARFDSIDEVNANQVFKITQSHQPVNFPITDGEYFDNRKDQAIFVFGVVGYSHTEACNLSVDGFINSVNKPAGTPPDSITLELVHNGVVIFTDTVTVASINTPISINYNFTELFQYGDCLYLRSSTTATGEAQLNTASITIGGYVSMAGANIPVQAGSFARLISLPTVIPTANPYVSGTSHVQYGFQYLVFNSLVPNTDFNLTLHFEGLRSGATANFTFTLYINGVQSGTITVPGTVAGSTFNVDLTPFMRTYQLGDVVFVTGTTEGNTLIAVTHSYIQFTSNYIKVYSLFRRQYESLIGIPNIAVNDAGEVRTDIPGAPYNVEVSPKTCFKKWLGRIKDSFLDQVTGMAEFQTLSKNQYLSRTFDGLTITEDADEDIMAGDRLAYPIEVSIKVKVPLNFAKLMSASFNGHVRCTLQDNDIFFYAEGLDQKVTLNDEVTWKGILSSRNSLFTFANINGFKLPEMSPTSIFVSKSSTIQFVPYTRIPNPLYHTRNRNEFLFKEQISQWVEQSGYDQPVQTGDPIALQFITREIDPISYTVYTGAGDVYLGPTNLDTIDSPAIADPYILWQKVIDTSAWGQGCYIIVISSPTVGNLLISECQNIQDLWEDTVAFQPFSTQNTQSIVFDGSTPFRPFKRIRGGYGNLFKQKYLGQFYVDQPADISVLNAIPYEVTDLFLKGDGGIPDYESRKILRYLLMDKTTIDGEGFTLNDGAEYDVVFTKGAPKKMYRIEIRPTTNSDGISVTSGVIDSDNSLIVSVNPQSFGPNITNSSGTTDTDLIEITVT
jgi:hypothetical protein